MVTAIEPVLRQQLIDRRQKLTFASQNGRSTSEVSRLLREVDAALGRMEAGSYGICEVCHDPVETERLLADPLTRLCIDHLSPREQRALEDDLELAAQIQNGLLPQPTLAVGGWEVAYHYEPAGLVSGDYCDLITTSDEGNLHFVLGDVSGKGVAASMLMAHLQATFRTLVSVKMPLEQMLERASRVFCESTLPTHYATLVCGNVQQDGRVEISNAGHLPPLLIQSGQVRSIEGTGLPLGLFSSEQFSASQFQMDPGDTLFLYTDGLSECRDSEGREFGSERLSEFLAHSNGATPQQIIGNCVRELSAFRARSLPADDLTVMAIQRVG
jgi:sigma-B regulation protein RsbU (phosphoserine phosphatase)